MSFKLTAPYQPTGDQPRAIEQLVNGINRAERSQTLLGVTGSGKTFTMANVIQRVDKPTLVISHNKTLAAQLYGELRNFFPDNAVEYFVSYYDYYQPEAYIPATNVYIEKELSINDELEKLRLRSTSALLTGRRDVIVVASVSCIYGIGNPEEFGKNIIRLRTGQQIARNKLLLTFVDMLYSRDEKEFNRGNFRVKGDTIDIFLAYADYAYRFLFWGDEIEAIQTINPTTGQKISEEQQVVIFPANLFVTSKDTLQQAIYDIQNDLVAQIKFFENEGRFEEAKRLKERTELDLEMLRELGYCSGIENYSRYFDRRQPGERPFCLLDYFPKDYLMIIDESHVTIPQVRGMWGGDRARKVNLVDNAFRLPSALDNRPLSFNEFESLINQVIFVSATPSDYELVQSEGVIVEQLIRPTGLLDPEIEVRPSLNQIDDLLNEAAERIKNQERVLITTLTKRMAEELTKYLEKAGVKCRYIHSEIKTLERIDILRDLRLGIFDVLVGVNLLREGLDLPEVSLVAILDADKEGFLRNVKSLIQTIGRAARNENGKVIMYADTITQSMETAIDETRRRRSIQIEYNTAHHITPKSVHKTKEAILEQTKVGDLQQTNKYYVEREPSVAADPIIPYMRKDELNKLIEATEKKMLAAADKLDFIEAARLKEDLETLKQILTNKTYKN
ncbi:MAG: excinuclease ABC subunit B [Candidatus Amoebophilus sp. 36-38]|nr:MAG: excinuclease ABC subunit B [Candidatus Amoebophilus sp. 36-38]